jgi:hypothetical protein
MRGAEESGQLREVNGGKEIEGKREEKEKRRKRDAGRDTSEISGQLKRAEYNGAEMLT